MCDIDPEFSFLSHLICQIKYHNLAKLLCDNTKNLPHVPITKMDRTISTLLKYSVTIIKFAMGVNHEFDLKTTSKLTFRRGFMIKERCGCKTGPNILRNNSATDEHIYYGYVLPIYWQKKMKLSMVKQMVRFVKAFVLILDIIVLSFLVISSLPF